MMKQTDVLYHADIVAAVKHAIRIVGVADFKRTSLFGSNEAVETNAEYQKAA